MEPIRMPQGIVRAVPWLAAACLVLGGCAEMPDAPAAAQGPAARVFDPAVFQRDMQRLKTADPDEIRRRFGVYELLMGDTFVSHDTNPVVLSEYRWIVPGALARVDYLECFEKTRKCAEWWFWVQYDPAHKRLNFLQATGTAWAHAEVRADGAVSVRRLNRGPFDIRFDFDNDEGIFSFPGENRTSRYVPTERQQFADVRKQWKQVHAETSAEEERVARAREAERQRVAQERAAEERRAEREADAERWNNINRAISGLGTAYRDTMAQHRQDQARSAALNARIAQAQQQSRPVPSTSSVSRTPVPSPSTINRPTATTLAPAPLTPLPKAAGTRSAPAPTSGRTPVPLKTNPLQPPRLSEQTLVAPQQPQTRSPAPSTTTSASARLERPIGPPGTTISVPTRTSPEPEQSQVRPAPTVVATAPPSLRDPSRERDERRDTDRNERGERDDPRERDPGKSSTRDDPNRCITAPIEADPVIGSRSSCKAFRVYNRCAATVDIRTCVYLTAAKKWTCELKPVAPNAYKHHESCSPHSERFVSVKYSDDHKTRTAMPPSR
jgi:hypothetical protein